MSRKKHTCEIGEMNYNKKSLNKNSSEKKIWKIGTFLRFLKILPSSDRILILTLNVSENSKIKSFATKTVIKETKQNFVILIPTRPQDSIS